MVLTRVAAALVALLAPVPAFAAETVLELFTSQSCSSCPPADMLLGELAARPGVLALSFHVDYWNRLGWRDPYSDAAYTARQKRYGELLRDDTIYTPELVVAGHTAVVGSDRPAVEEAIAAAPPGPIGLQLRADGSGLAVDVPAGAGKGTVWLVGFDPRHQTRIGGGENGGRTLTEFNVVRSFAPIGTWSGAPLHVAAARPAGERTAVLLQAPDGRMLGAAQGLN